MTHLGLKPHEEIDKQLPFERLLSEISTLFINLPADQIDNEIAVAQKRICELLDLDRSTLWLTSEDDPGMLLLAHINQQPPVMPSIPEQLSANRFWPWITEKVLGGETIVISKMTDLPAEANRDRESFIPYGNKSCVYVPLSVGKGPVFGVLAFVVTRYERDWPKRIVQQFQLIAQVFANALARKRTEFELVKSEKRLRIEIDERKRAERMLQNRLEFDRLLSETSARFAMISPDRLDTEIESSLRQMLVFFKVDRCGMVRTLPGKKSFEIVYMAAAENIPPIPAGTELPRSINPWAYDMLTCKREVISFSRMEDPPPEAAVDRQTWLTWGIRSHLAIPIILSDSTDWLISANLVKSERPWPEEIIQQFKLLGEILAGAIERNAADVALRESEERLNLAAAAAEAGLWIISAATWRIWATPKTRELFQFSTDEELSLERLLSAIHPDDRERVNSAVAHSLRHLETLQIIEYRVVLPDGGTRWMVSRGRSYPGYTGLADRIMGVTVDVTERKIMEETLQLKLEEIDALKLQLERENLYLREEIRLQHGHEEIVGRSDGMKQVLAKVEQVAGTDATVLLQGETGTGKELMAHAIHRLSTRRDRSLVAINCASLPPSLIESELFGREKGAFTGAMTRMAGRFEVADRSTFFLDEIGELSLDLQAKLLRVIEEGRFERLGSTKSIQVNVRIIAATNRDLAQEVAAGRFRRDLFYRLNVFPILIPPLRERAEDIPSLVWAFVKQYEKKNG